MYKYLCGESYNENVLYQPLQPCVKITSANQPRRSVGMAISRKLSMTVQQLEGVWHLAASLSAIGASACIAGLSENMQWRSIQHQYES